MKSKILLAACVACMASAPFSASGAKGHRNPLIMHRKHVPTVEFDRLRQHCRLTAHRDSEHHGCKIPAFHRKKHP